MLLIKISPLLFVVYSPLEFPTALPSLSVILNLAFARGSFVIPSTFVMSTAP